MTLEDIDERLGVIEEAKLLLAEQAQLEAAIAAERVHPDLKPLLDWVDADPLPLFRKAARRARRNGT